MNRAAPSRFRYRELDGVVWGDYEGDTVTFGRFVGSRTADDLLISFVHVLASDGSAVSGTGASRVEMTDRGVQLVERFVVEGVNHVSVCVEEDPAD